MGFFYNLKAHFKKWWNKKPKQAQKKIPNDINKTAKDVANDINKTAENVVGDMIDLGGDREIYRQGRLDDFCKNLVNYYNKVKKYNYDEVFCETYEKSIESVAYAPEGQKATSLLVLLLLQYMSSKVGKGLLCDKLICRKAFKQISDDLKTNPITEMRNAWTENITPDQKGIVWAHLFWYCQERQQDAFTNYFSETCKYNMETLTSNIETYLKEKEEKKEEKKEEIVVQRPQKTKKYVKKSIKSKVDMNELKSMVGGIPEEVTKTKMFKEMVIYMQSNLRYKDDEKKK